MQNNSRQSSYQNVIVACCFGILFVSMGFTSTTFNTFQPYINALPFMSDSTGSVIVAVRMGFAFLATLVSATYYRRLNCRVGGALVCFFTGAGFTVFALGKSLAAFLVGAALCGISYGLGGTVIMTIAIGRWFSEHRATALAIASMGSGLAGIVMPTVCTHLIERFSLSAAFFLDATLSALIGLLQLAFMRNYPPAAPAPRAQDAASALHGVADTAHAASVSEARTTPVAASAAAEAAAPDGGSAPKQRFGSSVLSRKYFLMMMLALFLLGGSSIGFNSYLSVLLKTNGFDSFFIAKMLTISGFCLMLFKFLVGKLFDKLGTLKASLIVYCSFILGIAISCLAPLGLPVLVVLGVVMTYAGIPLANIGTSVYSIEFSSAEERAATVRNFQMSFTLGTFIYTLFPGFLYEVTGTYVTTYGILAFSAVVSCIIVLRTHAICRNSGQTV